MYKIALVQNQSEMAHYGYADARKLLDDYSYTLFTGDNIAALPAALARRQVDALLLGTNALNDKVILSTLMKEQFASLLGDFMATGRGLLCMQQIGLAMRKGLALEVLPAPLGRVRPAVRPMAESAMSGQLALDAGTEFHVALNYPHKASAEGVQAHAHEFASLPGLYWHYWADVDLAHWDRLLVDSSTLPDRPLLLSAKESMPWRAVVSALPLDWQGHLTLFRNLLIYVTEGRHSIAMATDGGDDPSFEYLRGSLPALRLPYGEYRLPDDLTRLVRNVEGGIHTTLLISPRLSLRDLPESAALAVGTAVRGGSLRVLDIGPGAFGIRGVNVVSRELRPRGLLRTTELQIQEELRQGYIDDSFWSHVETLQTLEELPDRTTKYSLLQGAAWEVACNHDRDGSYDEIFGPTCAYYWFRAKYLGVNSSDAMQTASWLRDALPRYEAHERALAYLMFAGAGTLQGQEELDLLDAVEGLSLHDLSESHLILYLRAVLAATRRLDLAAPLAAELTGRQRDGIWVDLTTTATAANVLLDYQQQVSDRTGSQADLQVMQDSVRAAVVVILRLLAQSEASGEEHVYPWDGKASTTVRCLQLWMKFDASRDLPVYDILENLRRADAKATDAAASRTALTVVNDLNEELTRLARDLEAVRTDLRTAETRAKEAGDEAACSAARVRRRNIVLVVAAVVVYLLLAVLVGALVADEPSLGAALTNGFVKAWPFHFAIIGAVGTLAGLASRRSSREHV
jgi:hypothetical protein